MISNEITQHTAAPALETIECHSCGNVMAPDGKCLTVECEQAALQHTPTQELHGSVVAERGRYALASPAAWTIRGGVD